MYTSTHGTVPGTQSGPQLVAAALASRHSYAPHPSLFPLLWEAAVFMCALYLIPSVILGKQKGKV